LPSAFPFSQKKNTKPTSATAAIKNVAPGEILQKAKRQMIAVRVIANPDTHCLRVSSRRDVTLKFP